MKKILKYILIGVLIYVTIMAIEVCCLYAAMGDGVWQYLKDCWELCKTLI